MRNFNDEQFILFFANQHPQLFHDVAGAFHEFGAGETPHRYKKWSSADKWKGLPLHPRGYTEGLSQKERTPLHRGKRLDIATDIVLGRKGHGGRVSPEKAVDSFYAKQQHKSYLAKHAKSIPSSHPTNHPSHVRAEGKRVQGLLADHRKDDPDWISSPSSKARSRRSTRQAESRPATVGPNRKAAFNILKKSHPDKTLGQINKALDRQNIRNSEFEEFASDPTQSGLDRIRGLDRYENPIREKTYDQHKGGVDKDEGKPSIEEVQKRLDWSKIPKTGKKDMSEFYEFGLSRLQRSKRKPITEKAEEPWYKIGKHEVGGISSGPDETLRRPNFPHPYLPDHVAEGKDPRNYLLTHGNRGNRGQRIFGPRDKEGNRKPLTRVGHIIATGKELDRREKIPRGTGKAHQYSHGKGSIQGLSEFSHLNEFDCKRRVALGRKMLRFMEGSYA